MNAKEFCQKYNLGVDSAWIARKYSSKVQSLNEWFDLVKNDLTSIPDALSMAMALASQKTEIIATEDDFVSQKTEKPTSKKATEGK